MLPRSSAAYQTSDMRQFYTDAPDINAHMLSLLGPVDGLRLLEPCAGKGAFFLGLNGTPRLVDAVEIDEQNVALLKAKGFPWLRAIHGDFIDLLAVEKSKPRSSVRRDYDAVICNPPYGLRFSIEYRQMLKRRFPKLYVRESYGLFMVLAIRRLQEGGRYVFIVPDTFLTSRNHRPLREFLVAEGGPSHIVRFPSNRFETVDFGYGNLCIIAGNRRPLRAEDSVFWLEGLHSAQVTEADSRGAFDRVSGSFILSRVEDGWVHPRVIEGFSLPCPSTTLGEIAECKTGIYSGDNVQFCGFDMRNPPPRRSTGHPIDWESRVQLKPLNHDEASNGISQERCYVPFVRGGHRRPFDNTRWALNWSCDAVTFYTHNLKARLQNRSFYFRTGLAVPMVTCGRISASLMESAVFDQGVVGVFPYDPDWLEFLLIYLNSSFVSQKVKPVLNPGANNSANYIKRIPVPIPSEAQLIEAKDLVNRSRKMAWNETLVVREEYVARLIV